MTKQVSFSATVSALTMTLFALAVAVGNLQEDSGKNAANDPLFSPSVQISAPNS